MLPKLSRSFAMPLLMGGMLAVGGCATHARVAIYAPAGPPAALQEVIAVSPGPGYVWIGGYHRWESGAYVWVPGRWDKAPRARAKWVPGRWRHERSGWYWVEGRWR
jgi:WXXGXW repeat (2 copies)